MTDRSRRTARRTALIASALGIAAGGCAALLGFDEPVSDDVAEHADDAAVATPAPSDGGGVGDAGEAAAPTTGLHGELDPTFGDGGVVVIPAALAWLDVFGGPPNDCSVAIDEDAGIVLACAVVALEGSPTGLQTRAFRLRGDGALDPAFGASDGGGVSLRDYAPAVVTRGGKVLLLGFEFVAGSYDPATGRSLALRLDGTGKPDRSYGDAGRVVVGGAVKHVRFAAVSHSSAQPGAPIVVADWWQTDDASQIHYWSSGWVELDPASEAVTSVVAPAAGAPNYYFAGAVERVGTETLLAGAATDDDSTVPSVLFVAAYDGGAPALGADASAVQFGPGGDLPQSAVGLALGSAPRFYVASSVIYGSPSVLERFDLGGALDTSLGDAGALPLPSPATTDASTQARALGPAGDGLLVAGRLATASGAAQALLARLDSSGRPDPTFGGGGFALPTIHDSTFESIDALVETADGKVVVVGTSLLGDGTRDIFVLRYR